ncbi:MAG: DNA polymerase III subunit alpha [Cryomorphaceae bacterium]|nr:MAG: DNA polymerase III subunit alpha [Cryomorphaceae bacterium]
MFLIFDTETTGVPKDWNAPVTDSDNWPRMVQLAWQLHDATGKLLSRNNLIVYPDGYDIPFNVVKIHGISTERAKRDGQPLDEVLDAFARDFSQAKYLVGHNVSFDVNIVAGELHRAGRNHEVMLKADLLDTKDLSTDFCQLPGGKGGKYKWPTLTELHEKLFGKPFEAAHDAAYDVEATTRCFFALVTRQVIPLDEVPDPSALKYEAPVLEAANFQQEEESQPREVELDVPTEAVSATLEETPYAHLHCHSQFSILQSTSSVDALVNQAVKLNMSALAVTDTGNMMAAFQFVRKALAAGIKPILGCEINICRNRLDKSVKDDGFPVVLLAKNKKGYHNLAKLSSYAFTEGFYYVPRIDRELLMTYKNDLIALTGGLWGEVPYKILNEGKAQAEEAFVWWKEQFGEDFYAELNRHGLEEEQVVNTTLLEFCEKHQVKYVAANNTYYTHKEDADSHDVLLCIKDAENQSKPKKYMGKRGREFRFGFPNDEFYLKPAEAMKKLFADLPEAIACTHEIVEKCESYPLERDVLLPKFEIPEEFIHPEDDEDGGKRGENAFLRHLTYEGAKERWGELTDAIRERLDFELETIAKTGYPGYFLIVQDFCRAAREMGVSVGPGRGSAAGSAVAYCTGITNVDPIAYDLLFERFLNPDRVSMPDIDIDFDDEGRQLVINYVIEKYGSNQVAQIITYGTLAAKSSIRDAGRVLELPLADTDRVAKLVPDMTKLSKLFGKDNKALKEMLRNDDDFRKVEELIKLADTETPEGRTIRQARVIEGSVRNTGIHACGVIITPDDITNYVPIAMSKDAEMYCTQFDNAVAEDAGLLKMDFLGLKTLTIIKDAVKLIKERHGVEIIPDEIPLDDEKTYELFQRGETVAIFQYESAGMQKHLRDLKPTVFADLIAMNALYRPGPLEYIPSFISRKHGREEIKYDLPECQEYLEETYGITVYQEQVMRLSQKLVGFTKGEADTLRKAMGKKNFKLLADLKPKFLDQGVARGHDQTILEKIWKDWEAFASYAFNKSHSTCYALVAFHTAYLKAHFPAEYMAAVLSNNMNDIKSVSFFMEECRRMGVPVLGPSVNESKLRFSVNEQGAVRFGMAAVKGVGSSAVDTIVKARKEGGRFQDFTDFISRIDLRSANKKCLESLALAGAFDEFGLYRSQYFGTSGDGVSYLEECIKFGQAMRTSVDAPPDLFGDTVSVEVKAPEPPETEPWVNLEMLSREKEVVGMYISAHPLNDFQLEIDTFCKVNLEQLNDLERYKNLELTFAGLITSAEHRSTKSGKPFGSFEIEDFYASQKFFLFGDDYMKNRHRIDKNMFVFVRGRVVEKKWSKVPNDLEMKIHSVELLTEVREKMANSITISFQLETLNEKRVNELTDLLKSSKGGCRVKVEVTDLQAKAQITLPSKNTSVELTDRLIQELQDMEGVTFRLN